MKPSQNQSQVLKKDAEKSKNSSKKTVKKTLTGKTRERNEVSNSLRHEENEKLAQLLESNSKDSSVLYLDPLLRKLYEDLSLKKKKETIEKALEKKEQSDAKEKKTYLHELRTLSSKQVARLNAENLYTLEEISTMPVADLKILLDTTDNKASQILAEVRKNLPSTLVLDCLDLLDEELKRQYIPTGCKAMDDLFGGKGIPTGCITEVYGQYRTGKSQLAYSALIRTLLPRPYGLGGSAVLIDTEKTSNIKRLFQVASFYSNLLPLKTLVDNLRFIRSRSVQHQLKTVKDLLENDGQNLQKILKTPRPIKLVIVDSLTYNFRSEYSGGRGVLAERQQRLMEHLKDLAKLMDLTNVAVLVTNQVMGNPDPYSVDGLEKPVGGHAVGHHTTIRTWFKKKRNYHMATMVDAPHLPECECLFKLSRRGIIDVDKEDLEPSQYMNSQLEKQYLRELLESNGEDTSFLDLMNTGTSEVGVHETKEIESSSLDEVRVQTEEELEEESGSQYCFDLDFQTESPVESTHEAETEDTS